MRKLRNLAIAVAALFLIGTLAPPKAHANTTDTVIIICSIVGGLAVIALTATLIMRSQNKKIFGLQEPRAPKDDNRIATQRKVRFLTECPVTAEGRPMVCW
jgi:hypothetical protein